MYTKVLVACCNSGDRTGDCNDGCPSDPNKLRRAFAAVHRRIMTATAIRWSTATTVAPMTPKRRLQAPAVATSVMWIRTVTRFRIAAMVVQTRREPPRMSVQHLRIAARRVRARARPAGPGAGRAGAGVLLGDGRDVAPAVAVEVGDHDSVEVRVGRSCSPFSRWPSPSRTPCGSRPSWFPSWWSSWRSDADKRSRDNLLPSQRPRPAPRSFAKGRVTSVVLKEAWMWRRAARRPLFAYG